MTKIFAVTVASTFLLSIMTEWTKIFSLLESNGHHDAHDGWGCSQNIKETFRLLRLHKSVWQLTEGKDQRCYLNRQGFKSLQRTPRLINMNLVDDDKPLSLSLDRRDWDHAKVDV